MKRTYVYDKNGKAQELVREASEHHFIQPDFAEYGGRAAWRERLKANGSIEVSAQDLRQAKERWDSKKADFHAKLKAGEREGIGPRNVDVMAAPKYEMSQLNKEIANRLDGRPVPSRKMLIKLTLEAQRMLRGR
jgi:hypothetical protein